MSSFCGSTIRVENRIFACTDTMSCCEYFTVRPLTVAARAESAVNAIKPTTARALTAPRTHLAFGSVFILFLLDRIHPIADFFERQETDTSQVTPKGTPNHRQNGEGGSERHGREIQVWDEPGDRGHDRDRRDDNGQRGYRDQKGNHDHIEDIASAMSSRPFSNP